MNVRSELTQAADCFGDRQPVQFHDQVDDAAAARTGAKTVPVASVVAEPTAFMAGVPGKFFVLFGWTAAIAVFFSLVVARMLTPMMAAYISRCPRRRITNRAG